MHQSSDTCPAACCLTSLRAQTVCDAWRPLAKQGVWCSRALWARLQRTLETTLDEAAALQLEGAQMRAVAASAHEEAAVAGLLHEHERSEATRKLEMQARLPLRQETRRATCKVHMRLCPHICGLL
jgi:hypothetical protein